MSNNPWELKVDDSRASDNLYTFVIFCEDETSEYHYFKWFETSLIKVNVINKQKSMLTNITKAVTYCKENEILTFKNNKYSLDIEGIEIWCVYDRDIETNPLQILEKNNEFNLSIKTAEDNDINVAWSNDAFELWVLLHLMEIDTEDEETTKRQYYYEKLTDYFKAHPSPNVDLQKALVHSTFSYKKDMKHRDNFINIVRQEILPNTHIAIERSKNMHDLHNSKTNFYEKKPCTMVHNLVINLLEKGKKEIPKN